MRKNISLIYQNNITKMNITIESTKKITHLNGIACRIWEGKTEGGTQVHCFIPRIMISGNEPDDVVEKFEKELEECVAPSPAIQQLPLYLLV